MSRHIQIPEYDKMDVPSVLANLKAYQEKMIEELTATIKLAAEIQKKETEYGENLIPVKLEIAQSTEFKNQSSRDAALKDYELKNEDLTAIDREIQELKSQHAIAKNNVDTCKGVIKDLRLILMYLGGINSVTQ